jgi:hypothetical protein
MTNEEFRGLITDLDLGREDASAQLPDIDLYMDQLISLCDTDLAAYRRSPEDKLLTKTMINNYSKRRLLGPVHKHKYSRGQILMITLIYKLKQVASIDDIEALFSELMDDDGLNPDELLALSPVFAQIAEKNTADFAQSAEALFDDIKKEPADAGPSDSFLLAFALLTRAVSCKRLAEKIIDGMTDSNNGSAETN